MHCNITEVRKVGAKLVGTKDKVLDVDFLAIGSDSDQDIVLDDVYVIGKHAEIVLHKKKVFITAVDGENAGGISVNSKLLQSKKLIKGDVLNFGDFEITVMDISLKDSKLDLQIEKKSGGIPATRALPSRSSLGLEATWLKKRSWSIKSFILLLAFFLLIPLLAYFMPPYIAETLRALPVIPSDNSWEAGQLAHAHHIKKIGTNCNKCHEKPFVMVEDKSCANSTCHKKIREHVDPESYVKNDLELQRCGSCHKEHNGVDNDLIDTGDRLCFSCHHAITEDGRYDTKREVPNVRDLDDSHPEFRISMHKLNRDSMKFNIERYSLENIAKLKEESNLKFPHDKHLVYKGIENKTTGVTDFKMTCDSCHVPALAGDGFKPITRKDHCQDCHVLTFEPEFPDDRDRQVPHENSAARAIDYLKGYYSDRVLKGQREETKAAEKQEETFSSQRSRPGSNASSDEDDLSNLSDQEWVKNKVDKASKELFNSTTCVLCHNIIENKDSEYPWTILPVRLNESWFPKAKLFNHKKHASEDCTSCHNTMTNKAFKAAKAACPDKKTVSKDAKIDENVDVSLEKEDENRNISVCETQLPSSDSSDILMPQLDKCKECHTSKNMVNKDKTSCVTCHGFHMNKDHWMNQGHKGDKEE